MHETPQWAVDLHAKIDHLHRHFDRLERKVDRTMTAMDDLKAAVARNTNETQSAIVAMRGIKKQLDDIIAAGNNDPALASLAASITSDDDALAKAVTENTPAAPPTP